MRGIGTQFNLVEHVEKKWGAMAQINKLYQDVAC